ncbi:hypothetical protein ACWEOI_21640 [Nocardia sp. NPDC004340]|uniref:hypothetical protein n=1 Tax=Nocardia sp. CA-136227 TaxID=3239979 RepID=UPI003D97403D
MVMIWRCESVLSAGAEGSLGADFSMDGATRTGAATRDGVDTDAWVELFGMFGALVGFRLAVRAVLLEKTSP